MKRIQTSAVVLWLGLAFSAMAAEPVQERFQKALFEEEANQNITNAITGYEAVLDAADAPIRLAATALYRLGECHRKLGRTNEATAAFERLSREFAGQTNLVRLARQNLAVLGWREPSSAPERASGAGSAAANPAVQKAQADLAEAARIERVLEMAKDPESVGQTQDILEAGLSSPELAQMKRRLIDLTFRMQDARGQGADKVNIERLQVQIEESEKVYTQGVFRLAEQKRIEAEVLRRGAEAQLAALGVAAKAVPAAPEVGAVKSVALGKARFFGELNGTVSIPSGEEIWLSKAIIGLGRNERADLKRVRIHGRPGADGKAESVTVNVEKILKENLRSEDVRLRDGDRIEVPARIF